VIPQKLRTAIGLTIGTVVATAGAFVSTRPQTEAGFPPVIPSTTSTGASSKIAAGDDLYPTPASADRFVKAVYDGDVWTATRFFRTYVATRPPLVFDEENSGVYIDYAILLQTSAPGPRIIPYIRDFAKFAVESNDSFTMLIAASILQPHDPVMARDVLQRAATDMPANAHGALFHLYLDNPKTFRNNLDLAAAELRQAQHAGWMGSGKGELQLAVGRIEQNPSDANVNAALKLIDGIKGNPLWDQHAANVVDLSEWRAVVYLRAGQTDKALDALRPAAAMSWDAANMYLLAQARAAKPTDASPLDRDRIEDGLSVARNATNKARETPFLNDRLLSNIDKVKTWANSNPKYTYDHFQLIIETQKQVGESITRILMN
jgi:hypothetical protein